MILGLVGRLIYLMIFQAEYYQKQAEALHEREREIKAARGLIVDRNRKILAANQAVCTISVIHNQIKDPEQVIQVFKRRTGTCRSRMCVSGWKKFLQWSGLRQMWKRRQEIESGNMDLAGVKVDEDYKRYYPYGKLASKVLGFTGGDNQGIIGLEVKYEEILKGKNGQDPDTDGCQRSGTGEDGGRPD